MSLPYFMPNGLLPPFVGDDPAVIERSPYFVTMPDLVKVLGTSPYRRELLYNLIQYRAIIASGGYITGVQFIDGSFVENVEMIRGRPPSDIDVFSFLQLPECYKSDHQLWATQGLRFWSEEIMNQKLNRERFKLDAYANLVEEFDFQGLMGAIIYWYSLFSHQRDTFAWKGFLAIHLDVRQDAEALEMLEQNNG